MKAMIISDESRITEAIEKTLVKHGFDTIVYRWLLKALDNIEEIRPGLVIVSASEYPRHWKTLAQFIASGIGGDGTKTLVFCKAPLSDGEKKKASALGVKEFFPDSREGEKQLESILESLYPAPAPKKDWKTASLATQNKTNGSNFGISESVLFFTNPHTGKMITGNVVSYRNGIVKFAPESRGLVLDVRPRDTIDFLTFEIDSNVRNYKATVIAKTDTILLKLGEEINGWSC